MSGNFEGGASCLAHQKLVSSQVHVVVFECFQIISILSRKKKSKFFCSSMAPKSEQTPRKLMEKWTEHPHTSQTPPLETFVDKKQHTEAVQHS
jgi:hypothetical protein